MGRQFRKKVKVVINSFAEKKVFTISNSSNNASDSPGASPWTDYGQGDGIGQRVGDEIFLTTLSLTIDFVSTVADSYNHGRLLVIRWLPNTLDTGVPALGNILETASGINAVDSPLTFEANDRKRFHVILDKQLGYVSDPDTLQPGGDNQNAPGTVVYTRRTFTKKLGWKVFYNLGVTNGRNKIYTYYISDSTVVLHPQMIVWLKISYTDV